jgi:pimeloyl-ACP methyl ester carboxylesterase
MSLVALRCDGAEMPVFLVHGLGGTVLCYRDLAACLGADRPCYGIEARGIDDREPPLDCVEAMAAAYIDEIREQGAPPVWLLTGWSFGGLVAFEMSVQLARAGVPVRAALLDSRGLAARTARTQPAREATDTSFAAPPVASARCLCATDAAHRRALARYRPGHTQAPLLIVRATEAPGAVDTSLGFAPLARGPLETVAVPTSHEGLLLPPHVADIAGALDRFFAWGQGA